MTVNDVCSLIITAIKQKYRKYRWIAAIIILFLLAIALYQGWQNMKKPGETVLLTQEQAQTIAGGQLAADAAKVPLPKAQPREIAKKIEKIAVNTPPERVVSTTGAAVEKTVEGLRQEKGADFTMVTNPQDPTEKPVLKPDEPVKLNVYNVKAYPQKLVEVSIGADGGDIAYLHRVNIPKVPLLLPKGSVGYAGPFVRSEYGGGKVDMGLRIVMTF
jgi:hypothetical protein